MVLIKMEDGRKPNSAWEGTYKFPIVEFKNNSKQDFNFLFMVSLNQKLA